MFLCTGHQLFKWRSIPMKAQIQGMYFQLLSFQCYFFTSKDSQGHPKGSHALTSSYGRRFRVLEGLFSEKGGQE